MEFDFIIIGGGSAGCVLASRLSANPAHKVLLLEAGSKNNSFLIQIPFMAVLTLPFGLKNWHYYTQPQPGLNFRRGYQPRGKAIGGSSAINAMIYIRGQKEDYDEWSKVTSKDWSYEKVLPLFKSMESNASLHDDYHGQQGELSVCDLSFPNPASQVFIEAGKAGGFLSTEGNPSRPNIQLHFVPGIVDDHCHKMHFSRGMSLHVCILRPKSRGSIRLLSDNPLQAPAIDPNYLGHESDLQVLLQAYKMGKQIMEQDPFSPFKLQAYYKANSDDEIIQLIRNRADTVYHPVGSCRMGNDELAVVDPLLNVHGIEGLVVADASIMPQVVSGNTNAPTMMIAEQAARNILFNN